MKNEHPDGYQSELIWFGFIFSFVWFCLQNGKIELFGLVPIFPQTS